MRFFPFLAGCVLAAALGGCARTSPAVKLPKEGKPVAPQTVPAEIVRPKVSAPAPAGTARVAIIIDDAGHNLRALEDTLKLPVKLNVAVLPRLKHSKEIAEKLHQNGFEVMLHQPMEPENGMDPGPGAITTAMSEEEIAATLQKNLDAVPHLSGVNNHMGSKATADRRVMEAVLKTTSQRDLFFIDSLTSRSKVKEAAKAVGVPVATRDVFLDNDKNPEAIKAQIRKLKQIALKRGEAIGIGHFYPVTLKAIAEMIPELEKDGVQIVPVSQLIE